MLLSVFFETGRTGAHSSCVPGEKTTRKTYFINIFLKPANKKTGSEQ